MTALDAIVVGAGPNGLAAAVALAQRGLSVTVLEAAETIGGGTRTSELTLPGLLHDHCAAVHPMAVASPFLRSLALERHGLTWAWPEIDLAHPLDRGPAAVLRRSLDETVRGLGADGDAWRQLFAPLAHDYDALAAELMGPPLHLPRHPLPLARFGLRALRAATAVADRWHTPGARALFAGVAAHALQPLTAPGSAAIALMLVAAGHRHGWPVAHGGSQAVTNALAARLTELGGTVETGVRIRSLAELPPSRVTLLNVAPRAALALCGDRLPARTRCAYARWSHGPAAFKVDLAVAGGVPWRDEACRRAGTVHLGGTLEEVAHAERTVARGRMPERPFVLVGQQYLADPVRSAGDVHPLWAYAHVPHGYTGDATEAVLGQLERFAPGVRERVVARATTSAGQLEAYNANYIGGDILTGANTLSQMMRRPRVALDPYSTGIPGVFLCSAATPPGPGVHGMCGYHAARSALRHLGVPTPPSLP
ncbi:NAD(P)/FAD-dependent oxidoreductase [Streptomyces sp. NBC_00536]|uniref:phytoene desaturase family protein n=1 Tax=Streptomyces sp. NBC_00536 TaxID=2975769 RepID=UPI002E80AC72|nr:NAD(P)/FAD-dependent oxidoreductase [Streptomyces sp. NBC_00536]WUC81761.1 NAD(P)/FAD-dependent oxidoreductase [Streptomyces sp. NBC_00536]